MDTIKEYMECINFHWIIVVLTGMYVQLRDICLIGLCFEVIRDPPFNPSYATLIFVFSTVCLLAEYRLWPRSLKEPPIQLLIIYEILFTALVTDLVKRIVWVPLMHLTWCLTQESSKALIWMNSQLELGKYSQLMTMASYMRTDIAATHTAFCISVLSFLWMLDATETLDSLLIDLWAKY
ncbi:uncharacterized protein LOC106636956 [Copidosoma floridanum]|uniref:uncharacterized protein LOC106636956 n=1 Tax=Copidosoma floridanum TaxID=29053 RepID=UPI0006C94D00|nr:uncharacterized protein LOC106636956 [Copidosoma floridanum]